MHVLHAKAEEKGARLRWRGRKPVEIPDCGRDDLAQWFAEWGFNRGVEVGTQAGKYAEVLCRANPRLELTCVDSWAAPRYRPFRAQAYERLDGRAEIIEATSEDASREFGVASLDFVYIDAGHDLLNVVRDLVMWSPKVRPGGVVAGHDYIWTRARGPDPEWTQVVMGVNAYVHAFGICPWFLLGRKNKAEAKAKGEKRERQRSFCWTRPEVLRG